MTAAPRPLLETGFQIELRIFHGPAVNPRQMCKRLRLTPAHACEANVLGLMARRAERNQPLKLLDMFFVVIEPYLMTLYWPARPTASADFTRMPGAL